MSGLPCQNNQVDDIAQAMWATVKAMPAGHLSVMAESLSSWRSRM